MGFSGIETKSFLKQLVTIFSLSVLVACAGTDSERDDRESRRSDCIYQSSIRGYTILDESNLIVSASARRKYHMTLARRAYGLRSSWGIAFDSPTSQVCPSFGRVIFDGHFDGESIRIASIRELNADEEEDLLIRFGKKEPEIERTPAPSDVEGAEVEELDPVADESSLRD